MHYGVMQITQSKFAICETAGFNSFGSRDYYGRERPRGDKAENSVKKKRGAGKLRACF